MREDLTSREKQDFERLKLYLQHLTAEFSYVASSVPELTWSEQLVNTRSFFQSLLSVYTLQAECEIQEMHDQLRQAQQIRAANEKPKGLER